MRTSLDGDIMLSSKLNFNLALGACSLLILLLSGCTQSHPLGIPDEQWQKMTMDQQIEARQQQAELNRAKAEQRAEEARARAAEAEAKIAEREQRRQDARYRDRVQCVLTNGQVKLSRGWARIESLVLDLVRGYEEQYTVEVSSEKKTRLSC
jgi:hypothetical protein